MDALGETPNYLLFSNILKELMTCFDMLSYSVEHVLIAPLESEIESFTKYRDSFEVATHSWEK